MEIYTDMATTHLNAARRDAKAFGLSPDTRQALDVLKAHYEDRVPFREERTQLRFLITATERASRTVQAERHPVGHAILSHLDYARRALLSSF